MILGIGVDIVEIPRMKTSIEKFGKHFLSKIFTGREIAYSATKRFSSQHYAARFAAKEAVVKAFGEPKKHPINWTDVEVVNDAEGKPVVVFSGSALKLARIKKVKETLLTMSHTHNYAVANVILIKK